MGWGVQQAARVDVCICTYRRSSVVDTLHSLAAQVGMDGIGLRAIVVDNDDTPSAQALVLGTAAVLRLACRYVHAPARNISVARNAALDAADAHFVAFIDDDGVASPGWLAALMARHHQTTAPVVLGPVDAVYGDGPRWLRQADLHSIRPAFRAGGIIESGYSCNVLIARAAMTPAMRDARFDPVLGRTGGEDTVFFSHLHRLGAQIVFAPEARIAEAVAPHRAWLSWLLRRSFRAGHSHARTLVAAGHCKPCLLLLTIAKCGYCVLAAIGVAYAPSRWRAYAVRGALHAGVISRLAGIGEPELY
jgi:succinoglycan biosynthesis protein ExoM